MSSGTEKRSLTVSQVAGIMGESVRTVRHWCATGALPSVPTPGGHHRIPIEALRDRADFAGYAVSREESFEGF